MYRVILSSDNWLGGKPWNKDRFDENAKMKGLDILKDNTAYSLGQYVILKDETTFYHATLPEYVDSILKDGLICHDVHEGGNQADGVYLTGGPDDLSSWYGDETVILEVIVPRGTKVYRDYQPNAVFIKNNIPASRIKLLRNY